MRGIKVTSLASRATGIIMAVTGFVIMTSSAMLICDMVAGERSNFCDRFDPGIVGGIKMLLAVFLIYSGISIFLWGRKLVAKSAKKVLDTDTRQPIIYLRSFQSDPVLSTTLYSGIPTFRTVEEQIAAAVNDLGPFIAIKKPDEQLPTLGAARYEVAHDQWQQEIASKIQEAQLFILIAGETKGLIWELKHVLQSGERQRLVILVPFGHKDYQPFRQKVKQELDLNLPDYPLPKSKFAQVWRELTKLPILIRAVVYFDSNGKAQMNVIDRTSKTNFWHFSPTRMLLPPLKFGLKPVYDHLGLPWTKPKTSWIMPIVIAILLVLVIGLFALIL